MMGAMTARWCHGFVRMDGQWHGVMGETRAVVKVVDLPRQDLRRAAPACNTSGAMGLSNVDLIGGIIRKLDAVLMSEYPDTPAADTVWVHRDPVSGVLAVVLDTDKDETPAPVPVPVRDDVPEPVPAPVPAPRTGGGGSLEDIVAGIATDAVSQYLKDHAPQFDLEDMRPMLRDLVQELVPTPRHFHHKDREPVVIDGLVHERFDALVRKVRAKRNLMLTGEAGVGKTYLTKQVAEALGLRCVIVPSDVLPQRAEVIGGLSPLDRKVMKGKLRDLYEFGGVFVIDEFDRAHPSMGTIFNHVLAGSSFHFDDEGGGTVEVPKHPDFVFLATANTFGNGASRRYVGAQKMDAAGLDRFTFFHVSCDEALTSRVLQQTDGATAAAIVPIWTRARANVERYGLDVFVSPRCAYDAQAMMLEGDTLGEAMDGRLFGRGLDPDQETKLLEGISF